jgi:5'-phosphate synthase pdxT subunit
VTAPVIGLLALQGGVREHRRLLEALGAVVAPLRRPGDLAGPNGLRVDGVVLPGGESSAIDRLLRAVGLFEPLRAAIAAGLPALGTCAGLILLARHVLDPVPGQRSLAVLDVTVRRNAFGPQADSAEANLSTVGGTARAVFIRAPVVTANGPGVRVLARRGDAVVAVRAGAVTGLAFHPELTGETRFHHRLLDDAGGALRPLPFEHTFYYSETP